MSIVVNKTRLPVTQWQTASGSVVSIANARRRDAKSAIVTLEPIQDTSGGDPSPTNICPISGHSSVTLNHAGASQSDNPTSITVQLGQTVYGGTVDLCSGVVTVTKALQTWTKCGGAGSYAGCFYVSTSVPITKVPGVAIATYLKTYNGNGNSSNMPNWSLTQSGGASTTLWCKLDSSYTSKTDFDTFLASNPLSVCYELATPLTFQLTPTQIAMLERNNTIWADEGDIEVQYARIRQ